MPPMNATGRNTAISDSVVASTARPISRVPSSGGLRTAACPSLRSSAIDVLEHDDRVVDHDADREREREQRHHVEREAHGPHQREGADDRDRDRDRGDDRASASCRGTAARRAPRGSAPRTRCSCTASTRVRMDSESSRTIVERVAGAAARVCSSSSRSFTPSTTATVLVPDCLPDRQHARPACRRCCAAVSTSSVPSSTRAEVAQPDRACRRASRRRARRTRVPRRRGPSCAGSARAALCSMRAARHLEVLVADGARDLGAVMP